MARHSGHCLCGAVAFIMDADLSKTEACHCTTCRTQNGGSAFFWVTCEAIRFSKDTGLRWFKSSDWAERGFCSICGTTVAWRLSDGTGQPDVSIGMLDDASGVSLQHHIFVDEAGAFAPPPDDAPHMTGAEFLASIAEQGD